MVNEELGSRDEAIANYRLALAAEPSNEIAGSSLKRLGAPARAAAVGAGAVEADERSSRLPAAPGSGSALTAYNGGWIIHKRGTDCLVNDESFALTVSNGRVSAGRGKRGSIRENGRIDFTGPSRVPGRVTRWGGTFNGNTGRGTFSVAGGTCTGTFVAKRS